MTDGYCPQRSTGCAASSFKTTHKYNQAPPLRLPRELVKSVGVGCPHPAAPAHYNKDYSNWLKYNFERLVLYLSISILCYFFFLLNYYSEVNRVLLLHYIYLIHLVALQIWINNVKYNQHLNKTLVTPGVAFKLPCSIQSH